MNYRLPQVLLLVLTILVLASCGFSTPKKDIATSGGVRLMFRMVLPAGQNARVDDIRAQVIKMLLKRTEVLLGVSDATVVARGPDAIAVTLPGYTDLHKAMVNLGTSGRIQLYWAKNVVNMYATYRPYGVNEYAPANHSVSFQRSFGSPTAIEFGTSEYQHVIDGWDLIVDTSDLKSAEDFTQDGKERPVLHFSHSGADRLRAWCEKFKNQHESIGVVLDGRVLSIAVLPQNTVLSDDAVIDGTFTHLYIKSLCDLLNLGPLPVNLLEISNERVITGKR